MRKIAFFLLIACLTFNSYGQNARKRRQMEKKEHINMLTKQEEEGVIAYKKSFVFGAKLTTDGYGIFFELGRASSVKKPALYQLEFSERKHAKEIKVNGNYTNLIPYVYGKENFFYPLKLGRQCQILLGNKSNKNGVSVTGNYGGGISAGLLRPYYLEVAQGRNAINYIKYNSADSSDFLNGEIYGGPPFGKGWSDITVVPGLYVKAAVRFDYGSYNEVVSAIEIGISGEYYTKKIPQLVYTTQKHYFLSGYFAILFGKRK